MTDTEKGSGSSDEVSQQIFERPTGLKGFYFHPLTQDAAHRRHTGLFNSLNGLGAGGQVDSTTSANANAALYATFAFCAFFAGAINIHPNAKGFVIAAGAILGICAGLLWTAQGSLMMAYPTESEKGRYIGVFWAIFNLGGVVGASVALGQNFKSTANAVGNGTYIGFLVLTSLGVLIPMFMVDPAKMIRSDGTRVTTARHPSWKTEFYGLYVALRTDPMIVMLFPMFLASNWFYTWQFNDYNGAIFNIRARSLNNLVYWTSQIFGSLAIGRLLDQERLSRRVRAFAGWAVLLAFVFIVHIWAYFYQKTYTRGHVPKIDIYDEGYAAKVILYIFCGFLDAMWQTTAYWLMGAMSNDPTKLAHFAGFYKSIQSAGAAGMWRADAIGTPYMNIFASTWALLVAGLLFVLPMIHLRVQDHTDAKDDVLDEKIAQE
ncbi:hypothetical protein H0H92_000662 [Tricholoma furcatifolium]|nr:hypothetical protein H0H92_000662 [Tricholoma furcatifolium]